MIMMVFIRLQIQVPTDH